MKLFVAELQRKSKILESYMSGTLSLSSTSSLTKYHSLVCVKSRIKTRLKLVNSRELICSPLGNWMLEKRSASMYQYGLSFKSALLLENIYY